MKSNLAPRPAVDPATRRDQLIRDAWSYVAAAAACLSAATDLVERQRAAHASAELPVPPRGALMNHTERATPRAIAAWLHEADGYTVTPIGATRWHVRKGSLRPRAYTPEGLLDFANALRRALKLPLFCFARGE